MRNVILGAVGGLILGTVGALAISSYLNDEKVSALQSQLDAANASLEKAAQDKKQLSNETSGVSSQVDQLVSSNEELKKELDEAKKSPAASATAEPVNPATLAGMIMGMMRGGQGGFQTQQRLFLLQTRLHLTPEQATAIKTAMEADAKQRGELMRQMFGRGRGGQGQGGANGSGDGNGGGNRPDPSAAGTINSLDKTLASVLTPQQQAAYQQVQADEKVARADTAATVQVNQIAPLLQLSDSQKDQVFNALYQVQSSAPDPTSLIGNPNVMTALTSQAQATQSALAKVLTGDQMAVYSQQAQSFTFGGRGGGGNGGGSGAGRAPAPTGTGTTATAAAVAPGATGAPATTDATTTASATTNAPAATDATTNAAPAATDGSNVPAATNAAPAAAPQ